MCLCPINGWKMSVENGKMKKMMREKREREWVREWEQKSQTGKGKGTDEKIVVSRFLRKEHSPPSSKGEDDSLRKSSLLCYELPVLYHIVSSGKWSGRNWPCANTKTTFFGTRSGEQRAEKFTRPSNITKRLVSYKKLVGSIYLAGNC
jgi:hypothetical protein